MLNYTILDYRLTYRIIGVFFPYLRVMTRLCDQNYIGHEKYKNKNQVIIIIIIINSSSFRNNKQLIVNGHSYGSLHTVIRIHLISLSSDILVFAISVLEQMLML